MFGVPVVEASRLCAAADGGEILAAELVRALARGRGGFVFEPMGDLELKGLPEPVPAGRVIWEPLVDTGAATPRTARSRPAPRSCPGPAPRYVGRPRLLEQLDEHWRHGARRAPPRAVLLAGEPGVGKTRTAAELARPRPPEGGARALRPLRRGPGRAVPAVRRGARLVHRPRRRRPRSSAGSRASYAACCPTWPPRRPPAPSRWRRTPAPRSTGCSRRARRGSSTRREQSDGLVLVLDDLHWATKPTLLLMLHVLRSRERARTRRCSSSSPTATPTSTGPTRLSGLLGRPAPAARASSGRRSTT